MASTTYALLVGIDRYPAPIRPLSGCVADVQSWTDLLESRVATGDGSLELEVLTDEAATRQAIIERFRQHLGRARDGDTAVFIFCGHGSQAQTPVELHDLEPDRLDETLVCHDSRRGGIFDLSDKELSELIREVALDQVHLVLILDCCHSGTATRSLDSDLVRRLPTDDRPRPISSYLVSTANARTLIDTRTAIAGTPPGIANPGARQPSWTHAGAGRHVVLSACQADEEAKEIVIDGQVRGAFSHHLQRTLARNPARWTYRDLHARVSARVIATVARQSPRIEATHREDLDRPFLGGAIQVKAAYHGVHHEDGDGWLLDSGSVHGIAEPMGEETTHLLLFDTHTDPFADGARAVGSARVTRVAAGQSRLTVQALEDEVLDTDATYRAVVTSTPLAPLGVQLLGDTTALEGIREALVSARGINAPSLLVQEGGADSALVLHAGPDDYRIRRRGDDRPLAVRVAAREDDGATRAVHALEHMVRWLRMLELDNPGTRLASDSIGLEVELPDAPNAASRVSSEEAGAELRLAYRQEGETWRAPTFRLKLTNNSEQRLYCALLDLTDRFRIDSQALFRGASVTLEPGESFWAYDARPVPVSVPDELWREGLTEYRDVLKVIASTEPFDASRYDQGNLGVTWQAPRVARSVGPRSSLDKALHRAATRDMGDLATPDDRLVDWTTTELLITTVRPQADVALPDDRGNRVRLGQHLGIEGHPTMRARARLSSTPVVTRSMAEPPLPPWLRDDSSRVRPLDLGGSRSITADLSVVELEDVQAPETVTTQEPLRLHVDATLGENEHVLAVAYEADTGLYLPVGIGRKQDGRLVVEIARLPRSSIDSRSLFGSIKIFFKKVISKALGTDYEYPLLAAVADDGTSTTREEQLKRRVQQASRILVYIHGIIGDTEGMVESAFNPLPGSPVKPLGRRHDLVLTFDYENLNTPIEENARLLGQRLAAIGLAPGHDKQVHLVAHSMGGLVSRWFIEREGGNRVISHLVMLGTPNLGSPWSTVENYLAGAIGIGLNRLSAVAWPVRLLGSMLSTFERAAGKTLDQMSIGSPLIDKLMASPDPGIPYTVIAGNTSLIDRALKSGLDGKASLFDRLLARLNLTNVLHKTSGLAFFGAPNDVAVSVEAIRGVPGFAQRKPATIVDCDHMTYFGNAASWEALDRALVDSPERSTIQPPA